MLRRSEFTRQSDSRTPRGVRGLKLTITETEDAGVRSHPTRGAWIEMTCCPNYRRQEHGRTPRGVRGLKWNGTAGRLDGVKSHPTRGAWIEMFVPCVHPVAFMSHPTRGAWIEMPHVVPSSSTAKVAPHAGCVD